ncbi:hypothetical protein niasHS_004556 [Heterodera schachtii]|uniref:Uncharacterized protein n=2 Tax=Heterodera TaxID=34509 RepID=A0ABD2JVN8_HETSC
MHSQTPRRNDETAAAAEKQQRHNDAFLDETAASSVVVQDEGDGVGSEDLEESALTEEETTADEEMEDWNDGEDVQGEEDTEEGDAEDTQEEEMEEDDDEDVQEEAGKDRQSGSTQKPAKKTLAQVLAPRAKKPLNPLELPAVEFDDAGTPTIQRRYGRNVYYCCFCEEPMNTARKKSGRVTLSQQQGFLTCPVKCKRHFHQNCSTVCLCQKPPKKKKKKN